jgi:hypothetical protein
LLLDCLGGLAACAATATTPPSIAQRLFVWKINPC